MDLWNTTMDELAKIEREGGDDLTLDQRIQIQQAYAMLSVAQELSAVNPQNTTYSDADGNRRNGWGFLTHSDKL